MTIEIRSIRLHQVRMTLKHPFTTSFNTIKDKDFFIVEITDEEGVQGYGETVAFRDPSYTEETFQTTAHMMQDILIPLLLKATIEHPNDVSSLFRSVKRNHMAKAGLENAVWDLFAKQQNTALATVLGGSRKEVPVGISLGIEQDSHRLLNKIDDALAYGYQRIKIKIKPETDLATLTSVRQHFPDIPLMVDANSAYALTDMPHLKKFDDFDLLMIEQPLADDDILDHAQLQKELTTPICLDESIHTLEDARLAIALDSCRIINIKNGRVGGLTAAKQIHDLCQKNEIDVWCGGMLEAGIGRAHNIALASLSQFTLPGDISASNRYWHEDIIKPEVTVDNGMITVGEQPGIGYQLDEKALKKYSVAQKEFHRYL